jgi:cell division septum initiation protein DivIVA
MVQTTGANDRNPMTDPNNQFRSVLRGYDPAQVDRHVSELTKAATKAREEATESGTAVSRLEAVRDQLKNEVEQHAGRVSALQEAQTKAVNPSYAGLGERIGSILTLVDKEAHELRARAAADAANQQELAKENASATRRDADHYAREIRSAADVEAARALENARRKADSTLEDADRQATVRREETEALFELARAKSATEAVEFESNLAARKEASATQFAAEVGAAEQQLTALRLQAEESRVEAEEARQETAARSAQELEQARAHARKLVAEAKLRAEHIRSDSERELAAATQRRDSINVQLSNVRQMIAALGGAPIVESSVAAEAQPGKAKGVVPAAWQPKEVTPAAWQSSRPPQPGPAAQPPQSGQPLQRKTLSPAVAAQTTAVIPVAGQAKKQAPAAVPGSATKKPPVREG